MYMLCPGLAVNATQLINELELLTVQRAMHPPLLPSCQRGSVSHKDLMSDILKKTLQCPDVISHDTGVPLKTLILQP